MRNSDGSLFFDTQIDNEGFERGLKKLEKLGKTSFAAIGAAATTGLGAAVKVGMDFEAQMSKVGAISMASAEDMEVLSAKAKEMGEKTVFSATQAGEAFEYMAMAGWKTQEMTAGIAGIMDLAAASGENLAVVSDIVTDALTAFGLTAKDSGRFADVLAAASSNANTNVTMMGETFKYAAPLAGSLGYSIEDTAVAIGLMANAGIKGGQAGTSLRSVLTRLAKPTGESKDAIKALGLSVTDSSGAVKPFNVLMKEMRQAFSKLTEAEKPAYAAMLGGQEALSGLLAIVNASESDFEKLTKAVNNSGGAVSEMAERNLDNLKGSLTLAGSAAEGLGIKIYESIEEPLRNAVEKGTEYITGLTEWISAPGTVDGLTFLASGIGVAGSAVLGYKAAVSTATIAQALFNTTLSLNPFGLAAAGVVGLTAATVGIIGAVREADSEYYKMGETITGVSSAFDAATEKSVVTQEKINTWETLKVKLNDNTLSASELASAQNEVKSVEEWFIQNYGSYITAEEQKNGIRQETVDKLKEQEGTLTRIAALELESELRETKSDIPELAARVEALRKTNAALDEEKVSALNNQIALQELREEWLLYASGIEDFNTEEVQRQMDAVLEKAEEITGKDLFSIEQIDNELLRYEISIGKLGEIIEGNSEKIADGEESISKYRDSVQKLIDFDAEATFEEKVIRARSFGLDFSEGIVSGIDIGSPTVLARIDTLVSDMVERARKKAGVNSPSKVTRDMVGKPIAEGVAVGIDINAVTARKASERLITSTVNAAKKKARINSPAGLTRDGVGKWLSLGVAKGITESSDEAVKAFNAMLEKLKYQRELDIINDEQYYTELERLRDKYFAEGSKEWLNYTGEIYDHQKSVLEQQKKDIEAMYSDIADHATKKIEEVISKQEAYKNKLTGISKLYDTDTLQIGDQTITTYTMHDFSKDIELINEFTENVDKLKSRLTGLGFSNDVISSYMSEFDELDTLTATQFIKSVLGHSDTDLKKNIEGYSLGRRAADSSSAKRYKEEMQEATEDAIGYMEEKLREAGFTDIPEGFFLSGQISAEKFGEAFVAELENQMTKIQNTIAAFNASLNLTLQGAAVSGSSSGNNTINNSYAPVINLNSKDEGSTQKELRAVDNFLTLERMRGGYTSWFSK